MSPNGRGARGDKQYVCVAALTRNIALRDRPDGRATGDEGFQKFSKNFILVYRKLTKCPRRRLSAGQGNRKGPHGGARRRGGKRGMIPLSAQLTALIVTISMGFFFAVVSALCVVPLYEALIERRRPNLPNLPATFENLGLALAIGGLTYRATGVAAVGIGLAVLGTLLR
ncbi:MAG TPA: hypothetical protein ENO23_00880, partial [Alphaproteobacteria bacterium]|nr:hypothetical protein [Alphaproteobacteria bacterium]